MRNVDLSTERIDAELKSCIEEHLASLPGARVIKRKGRLFFKGSGGFEILCERLCAVKARWVEKVEHADFTDEQKWQIFALLLANDDARLEEVPGLGLKVIVPPRPRH